MPKVSVLTPLYNTNLQYLKEFIESILNQTFTDFELLLLNDSPDNKELEKVALSYHDDRIKFYYTEKNIGISESRNKLIEMARGEYLAVCDHDDVSYPTRLEKQVNFLDRNRHIGIVSGLLHYIDDKKGTIENNRPEFDIDIKIGLMFRAIIAHPCCMIRKSVLIENKIFYKEIYSPCEDYKLFIDLIAVTDFGNIQEPLLYYRIHNENTSKIQYNKMKNKTNIILREARVKYPTLYKMAKKIYRVNQGSVYYNLFKYIPFLKIKDNKVFLFNFIPLFYIKYKLKW